MEVDTAGREAGSPTRWAPPTSVLVLAASLGELADGGAVRELSEEGGVERIEVLALADDGGADRLDGVSRAEVVDDLLPGSARWLRRAQVSRATEAVRGVALRRRLAGHDAPVLVVGPGGARLLHWLPVADRRVVVWVPQFGPTTDLPEVDRQAVAAHRPTWVAGSPQVAAAVAAQAGVERSSVAVLGDPWPDPGSSPVDARRGRSTVRRRLAEELEIDVAAPLVCSGGPIDPATTGDAFIQLAWELSLRPEATDLAFGWLPHARGERHEAAFVDDLRAVGLEHRIRILPDLDPLSLVAAAEVYVVAGRGRWALPSYRRAVAVGCPVVWFSQPMLDAADPAHGAAVEPSDLGAMGEAVLALARGPRPVVDDETFGSRLLRHLVPA